MYDPEYLDDIALNPEPYRCPHGLCAWDACACVACESCEAVHSGPCVEMSAAAEDRLTNGQFQRNLERLASAERWGVA